MKISRKILFITLFIICMLTNLVMATSGKVNIQATRIREEASTTSNIVTVIYENDEVEILEESGEWYKVNYNDYTGYVKQEFITQNEEENKLPADESALIIKSETYAKVLPNFSSSNVVKFDTSKAVSQIAELNNWIQVTDGENTGWILKSKVQTSAEAIAEVENTPKNENTTVDSSTIVNETSTENNTTNTNTTDNTTNTITDNTVSSATTTANKTAIVIVETAKIREEASTSSNVLGFADYGDEITLLEQNGDWYKINFEGQTGYIKNTLIQITDDTVSSRSSTEERENNQAEGTTARALEVVNYATQYLGYAYTVGGKSPSSGFDCSGFTRYVFLNFGYTLGSTASSQASAGEEVSRDNLQSGDLVLFLNEEKTSIGHTGIYIENGDFIHAANPQRGVVTDNLNTNSYYSERFVSARRLVK